MTLKKNRRNMLVVAHQMGWVSVMSKDRDRRKIMFDLINKGYLRQIPLNWEGRRPQEYRAVLTNTGHIVARKEIENRVKI